METIKITGNTKKKNAIAVPTADLCNAMGILTFLCLMVYFTTMRSIGLYELFVLRDFNSVILATGILIALSYYKRITKAKIDYSTGLQIGLRTTVTAVLPFTLFIYFYLSSDYGFMELIKNKLDSSELTSIVGNFITPGFAAMIICLEGLISGVIITLIGMQFYKK